MSAITTDGKVVRDGQGASPASPAFTGTPTAPTGTWLASSTQVANQKFVLDNTMLDRTVIGGGTANALTGSISLASSAVGMPGGMLLCLYPSLTNTGAATLALNGNAALPILTQAGAALVGGDLVSHYHYILAYTASAYYLLTPPLASIAGLATLDSPAFTTTPTAPTAAPGTNTQQIATTAFVQAAGGGSLTRIGQVVADGTSATMTVGSIPGTYSALIIHFQGRGDSGTNNQSAYCRLNGDSGANYSCEMTGGSATSSSTSQSTGVTSLIDMAVPAATSTALRTGTIQTTIIGYANAFAKVAASHIAAYNYETFQAWLAHSVWASAAAVTSVTFGVNSGNWVAGSTLTVYGMS